MDKPRPKTEIAVRFSSKIVGAIIFYASKDAAEDMRDFGRLDYDDGTKWWYLSVDARYDFDEVLKYIEEYGK